MRSVILSFVGLFILALIGIMAAIDLVTLGTVLIAVVVVVLFISLVTIAAIDQRNGRWGDMLRSRFVMGIPWGSLITIVFVLFVYLFLQDGWTNWHRPITLPFRSWSYFYPLGWLTAAFSHNSPGHLMGNLTGTIVLAPLAEYAWGHYPRNRGDQSFSSWRTNPWIRALAIFPGVVFGIGLLTSLFALGPIIGFSGVVFAFGGFALVHYPILTIFGLLATGVVRTVYNVLANPIVVVGTTASPPAPPPWATIAIQGHALGVLIGVLLGIYVARKYDVRPSALKLWSAVIVYAIGRSLWAVYWFRGGGEYVLHRGLGLTLVMILAILVTLAVTASDRPLFPSRPTIAADWSRSYVAICILLIALALIAGPAIPTNLMTVGQDAIPNDRTVTTGDFTVTYAENTPNRMIPVIDIELFGETTDVRTSGVIVISEDRHIWTRAISKQRLEFSGRATIPLGGPGWRSTVTATRHGWELSGSEPVYQIWLRVDGGTNNHVFASPPQSADAQIANRTIQIEGEDGTFFINVRSDDETIDRTPIPGVNQSVDVGGLTLSVIKDNGAARIYASHEDTRVLIAQRETYY